MPTPNSSAAPYCTPQQFLSRFDVRFVQDLLADAGARLTPQEVASSPALAELLGEASGMVEAACFVSNRYTAADLAALAGPSREFLVGLTAGLTLWLLWDRRPRKLEEEPPLRARVALEQLQFLRDGQRIFGLQEHADAGLVDSKTQSPEDAARRGGVVFRARRFFGAHGPNWRQPW
jgi:hypothetical protein